MDRVDERDMIPTGFRKENLLKQDSEINFKSFLKVFKAFTQCGENNMQSWELFLLNYFFYPIQKDGNYCGLLL